MAEPLPDLVIFLPDPPPGFAGEMAGLAEPAAVEVAAGRPAGRDLARGRYLALWDQAVRPEPGAVSALVEHMDENPLAAIAAPAVSVRGRVLATSGRRPGPARVLAASRIVPLPAPGMEVETVTGPPVILRPEALEETGMPAAHAAAVPALCRRALRRGWRVHAVRRAVFTAAAGHDPSPRLAFLEICRYLAGI